MHYLFFYIFLLFPPHQYPDLASAGKDISSFIPKGYHIIYQAKGHLNADVLEDHAIIIESDEPVSDLKEADHAQNPRILFVLFADVKGGFSLAVQSNESLMLSDDGGVFGDPLQEVYIANKVVNVEYYGGSAEKWSYTYKWRFQKNDWYLIGATYTTMSPFENILEKYDFNLNTGVAEHTMMPYLEEDEGKPVVKPKTKRFNPGKKPLFKLRNFRFGENMVYKDIYI